MAASGSWTSLSSSRDAGPEGLVVQPATPVESRLVQALLQGGFVVTAEIVPPLSADGAALGAMVEPLRERVDALVVGTRLGRRPAMARIAAAAILAGTGFDPVLALAPDAGGAGACADDLVGGAALGVRTLLIQDGESAGGRRSGGAARDDTCLELIRLAASVRDRGTLPSGQPIESPPRFFIGAVETALASASAWRPEALQAKVAAGAQFIVVRGCFEPGIVRRAVARLEDEGLADRLFVLVAIEPPVGRRAARPAASSPAVAAVFRRARRTVRAGGERAETCAEFLAALADIPGVAGAHFVAPREVARIAEAVELSGLRARDVRDPRPPLRE